LLLSGKQPSTIACYRNAIAHLAEHFACSPEKLSEAQVRQYVLLRRQQLQLGSMRPIVGALKFFFRVTVPRDWPTLQAIRFPKSNTLPMVLVPERCWQLIDATVASHLQVIFRAMYSCGLRGVDVRHLRPQDVDADRMMLRVCTTKGHRQREVPLPQATLDAFRAHWATHRNPNWLFPATQRNTPASKADQPISARTIQRGFTKVTESLGWQDSGLTPHTLRHSYATAMLDAGVNLKVLQGYLGHKNLQATEVYLHLTRLGDERARQIVAQIMNGDVAEQGLS